MASRRTAKEAYRIIAVSIGTCQCWKGQYACVKKDALNWLRELEKETNRLKKLVAGRALDMAIIKEVAEGKW